MALNTSKRNHLTPLHFKGLTSHSTHNGSFQRWVFPGNRFHWYWQPNNNNEEMHRTQKKITLTQINRP